ncbi:uncharacterized protein LOC143430839 [Xylocopa sonorina]|uniref:uncharacterized protein LOC143430839 n=1 Tax=Xylocopa sonorina TaxID=1818115 RepID=UPI00403AA569
MTTENEAWAQTLITVTPEDDATLREISQATTLSSTPDAQLILDPDEIVYRRSFTNRQFVDSKDEEEEEEEVESKEVEPKQDAESQTYLQGTTTVHISVEYQDEASQTMYMSTPCPPLKYFKDIMTSMNESPMPKLKKSNLTATIISIHPETSHDVAMEQLSTDVTEEEREEFVARLSTAEETEMEVTEILHFLIARALWINNPSQTQVSTTNETTQTCIAYNNRLNIFLVDSQVQTDLSCEPKQSNTMLLTDYWETKNMISNYLEDCISKGIEIRIVVNDVIDEIVDKCAGRIKYPMKEQMIQTIATYKLDGEKEEDVLRKLRLDIIVDPLEASIIVIPLMGDLLQLASDTVSRNALKVAPIVLDRILQRTMTIIVKLMELQKQSEHKPIDEILARRKKRILESMLRKDTETISTQTSIAGISEIRKIKRSKEVLCSVCRRQSMCEWCLNDQETESAPAEEETKMLRTQDILLAYKPCYMVTKVSEKSENLQPPCPPLKRKVKPPSRYQLRSSKDSTEQRCSAICLFLQADKNVETQESFNEWSYVTDATIMKPYSIKESVNSSSQTTIPLLDQSTCQDSNSHRSTLTSRAENALQILKDTFCSRENCITSSLQSLKDCSFAKSEETYTKQTYDACSNANNADNKIFGQEICIRQTCRVFSNLRLPKTSTDSIYSDVSIKSHGDGFNIVPIYLSQDFCTKEFHFKHTQAKLYTSQYKQVIVQIIYSCISYTIIKLMIVKHISKNMFSHMYIHLYIGITNFYSNKWFIVSLHVYTLKLSLEYLIKIFCNKLVKNVI